jgi:predicted phosphodiesterase
MSTTEVTVVWTTNKTAVSWVEIAPDDGTHFYLTERPRFFATKNGVKLERTTHAVKITGLKPATRYRYRIYSQEVLKHEGWHVYYGDVAANDIFTGKPYSFKTLDEGANSVKFCIVNDIHGRNEVMEKLFGVVEPAKQDMVFFNGDMVSMVNSAEELFNGFMDVGVKAFAKEIPLYYCRGNHETRGSFATSFQDYFSPLNPELYFLVRQGQVCFVVLDCGEDKPDSDLEYAGITDYDAYRTREAEWLREALKDKRFTEAKFRVVVCHIPPAMDWHGESEILLKFVPLLNEAGIDVMLCGHYHRTLKWAANDKVKFPVLINSNNSILKGVVEGSKLTLDILNLEGARTEGMTINK